MCFLVEQDDERNGEFQSNSGAAKLQLRNYHKWLLPWRCLVVLFGVSFVFFILGSGLMAIGGGIGSRGLYITGSILFALAVIGLIICLIVCIYAYLVYGTRNQAVQTETVWTDEYQTDGPGYSSIGRPSALKSADSTLKRNGVAGQKKVTMAPELGPSGESPPNAFQGSNLDARSRQQLTKSPSFGSGTIYLGDGSDPRGVGGRSVSGSEVGTGGIRITTLDRNQPFPSPGSQVVYGGGGQAYSGIGQAGFGTGPGHVIYSGGGSSGSASSSMDANYAYPKNVSVISGQESGFSDSGSQYSTLRPIPVTHIVAENQRQQRDNLEYARINKPAKNVPIVVADAQSQRGYSLPGHGYSQGQGYSQSQGQSQSQGYSQSQGQSQSQGYSQSQGQVNQFEQRFPITDDFDYDNPVERTPMISPKQPYGQSYHEQQMQYQRQQRQQDIQAARQQDLHAPRQLNMQSLQRQTAINPNQYHQEKQHHTQYDTSTSSSHSVGHDDLPDLQPLVYPSARRPMTFEQVSSSKMSVYDNVLAGLKDDE